MVTQHPSHWAVGGDRSVKLATAGNWDPLSYVQRSQDLSSAVIPSNLSTSNTGKPLHQFMNPSSGRSKRSRNDMYMLPVEYTSIKDGPEVISGRSHLLRPSV